MTEIVGILGDPIRHSLSPNMMNAAIAHLGIDLVYLPLRVRPARLSEAVSEIRKLGFRGANVTVPHKEKIVGELDGLTPEARGIGAVNTIVRSGRRLIGHNTDAYGFAESLRRDAGVRASGKCVFVLGAGGAARAVVAALHSGGARRIVIANRTRRRALVLARAFRRRSREGWSVEGGALDPAWVAPRLRHADLLVNTTSVGMGGGAFSDLPLEELKRGAWVADIVYTPLVTPLLQEARRRGHPILVGTGMLAFQGARSLELWTGKRAPVALMRRRIERALRGRSGVGS